MSRFVSAAILVLVGVVAIRSGVDAYTAGSAPAAAVWLLVSTGLVAILAGLYFGRPALGIAALLFTGIVLVLYASLVWGMGVGGLSGANLAGVDAGALWKGLLLAGATSFGLGIVLAFRHSRVAVGQ